VFEVVGFGAPLAWPDEWLAWLVPILPAVALYFLPSIFAVSNAAPQRDAAIIINVFLGWTLIGWVVAAAMATARRGD